jgi:hypothetical protein
VQLVGAELDLLVELGADHAQRLGSLLLRRKVASDLGEPNASPSRNVLPLQ